MKVTDEQIEQIIRGWSANDKWPEGFTVTHTEDFEALLRRLTALRKELSIEQERTALARGENELAAQSIDELSAEASKLRKECADLTDDANEDLETIRELRSELKEMLF